jgi:hypothetical protein
VASNTHEIAFAQSSNNIVGCASKVKVTISHLSKQTAIASSQVTLSNIGPDEDQGFANINNPGIGNDILAVSFHQASYRAYNVDVSDLPKQTLPSNFSPLDENAIRGQSTAI